ncbi:MAG: hypothetical protein J6F30_04495 [Cellulosilyticum sp.]|nr:hypothetical protein [Cellulosilyticum sp.]
MIDAINGKNYNSYTFLNESLQNVATNEVNESKEAIGKTQFDIQEILNQINEYTYSQQDKEAVSEDLVKDLKEQYNLKEEDVYELYKRGVDLEQLSIQDIAYRSRKQENEEETKAKEDNESLEEKIEVIKKQSDSMYLHALNSNGPITINSLYENSFKGELKKGISQYTKEDVDNVLSMNGLKANEGNEWAANLLMMYDMGVSPTSISRLQGIQSAVSAIDTNYSGDDELVKDGQVQYQPEYVDRITDDLGMVTDEHIEKLIEEGKEININELRDSIHKHASEALDEHQTGSSNQNSNQEQGEGKKGEMLQRVDEVKRQILQITTKLTVEAAQKISETMPLESSSLQAVADALTKMEQEMAISALEQVNLPATEENISTITNTMDVVDKISENFMPTVQIEIETGENTTLNEINAAISEALNAYRENETPVETRFGESIKTVENQIAHLLETQGIEATTTNIEAAKALITNGIEVSAEQIQNIQDIVLKLNTFLEEMTPIQVASMLKEGFNPYHASVNEILAWMSDSKVEGLKTSVAEAIVSLEASGQINDEQKEGMIGLYRIMQAVTKQKEQVMGYLYRNELPMTVENLQIASKYVRSKNRVQATIDDNFGEVESRTEAQNTASKMLEHSKQASEKTLETIKMLEEMELPITEENVDKVSKMSALLYPYIKEQFKKNVGKFDGMNTLPDSFLEKIQVAQNTNTQVIESMLEQDIPLTLSNIYWMEKMSSEPEIYGELLNDKGLLKEGLPKDLEELEDLLEEIATKAKEQKEEATLTGQWNDYRNYKQLEEVVQFQRQRIENEGLYQIPFMIDGERKLVNLYVQEDSSKSGSIDDGSHLKAMISYETKAMGTVKAFIEMNGENLGYRVEAENAQDSETLKAHAETLLAGLKSIGYNVNYSAYEQEESANVQADSVTIHKHEDSSFEQII